MTLIELLIAVALGMAMIAMAWTAFVRANESTTRATARVDLHAAAAVVREYLNRDLANSAPANAFFVRSRPQVDGTDAGGRPIRTDTVELLFMRLVNRLGDEAVGDTRRQYKSEFTWVRWRFRRTWSQADGAWRTTAHTLHRSASTPAREWTTTSAWATPTPLVDPYLGNPPPAAWMNYGGRAWLNLPRPLRDASQGIESLDHNRYGINPAHIDVRNGDMGDIGDLQDLDRSENDRLVSDRVRDFAVGWHDAHGDDHVVGSATAADHRLDGLYLDLAGPAGNDHLGQLAQRPRVVRVAFNLADAASGVSQDFTFSVAMPGIQAQVGE